MNVKNYHFEIGDEVITTRGEIGKIIDICKCEECTKRGFFEPIWVKDGNEYQKYIDIYDAKDNFSRFYKIGKYRFNDFDKAEVLESIDICESELKQLRKQLKLIEELEIKKR